MCFEPASTHPFKGSTGSHPLKITALVLAAGASRRLGFPKQGVLLHGETLLARTVRLALEAGCDIVRVVLGFQADHIRSFLGPWEAHERLEMCVHSAWEAGMGSSLAFGLGVKPLAAGTQGVLVLLCDQVALDLSHLRHLIQAFEQDPRRRVASGYQGLKGVPALFPVNDLSALSQLHGDQGARELLRKGEAWVCDWPQGTWDLDCT